MNVQSTTCSVSETLPVWDRTCPTNHKSFSARISNETYQRESIFSATSLVSMDNIDSDGATKKSKILEKTKNDSLLADDDRIVEDTVSCFEVVISVDNEAQSGQNIVFRTIDDDAKTDREMQVRNGDDNNETVVTRNIKERPEVLRIETCDDSNLSHDGFKTTSNGVSCLNFDDSSRDAWHPRVGVFDKFYDSELNVNVSQNSSSFANIASPSETNERTRNKSSEERVVDADASNGLSSDRKRVNSGSGVEDQSFKRFASEYLTSALDDVESDEDRLIVDMDVDDEVSLKSRKPIEKDNSLGSSNKKQFENALNVSSGIVLSENVFPPSDVQKRLTSGASIRSSLKRLNFKPLKKLIENMCIPSSSSSGNHASSALVNAPSTVVTVGGVCSVSTCAAIDSTDSMDGFITDTAVFSSLYTNSTLSVSDTSADGSVFTTHLSPSSVHLVVPSSIVESGGAVSTSSNAPLVGVSENVFPTIPTSINSVSTLENHSPIMSVHDTAITSSTTRTSSPCMESSGSLLTVSTGEHIDICSASSVSSAPVYNSTVMARSSGKNYSSRINDIGMSPLPSVNGLNVSIPVYSCSASAVIETATVSPFIDSNSFEMVSPRAPPIVDLLSETVFISDNPSTVIGVGADGIIGSTDANSRNINLSSINYTNNTFSSAALPLSSFLNVSSPAQIVSTTVEGSATSTVDSTLTIDLSTNVTSSRTCGLASSDSPPSQTDGLAVSVSPLGTTNLTLASCSLQTITLTRTDDSAHDASKAFHVISVVDTLPTASAINALPTTNTVCVLPAISVVDTLPIVDIIDSLPITMNSANALPTISYVDAPATISPDYTLPIIDSVGIQSVISSVNTLSAVSSIETLSAGSSVNSSPRFISTFVSVQSPITNPVSPLRSTNDLSLISTPSTSAIPTTPTISSAATIAALSDSQTSHANNGADDQVILTKNSMPRNKRKAPAQTVINDADEDDGCIRIKQEKLDDGYEQSATVNMATSCSVPVQVSNPVPSRKRPKVTAERKTPIQPKPIQPNVLAAVAAPWLITNPENQNVGGNQIQPNLQPTIGIPSVTVSRDPRTRVFQSARPRIGVPAPMGRPPLSTLVVPRPRLSFHTVTFAANGKQSRRQDVVVTPPTILNRTVAPATVASMSSNVHTRITPSVEDNGRSSTATEFTKASPRLATSISMRINSVVDRMDTSTTKFQATSVPCVSASPSISATTSSARMIVSTRTKKRARRSAQFWTKFKHWFQTNALDAHHTPTRAPDDLHLSAVTVQRLCVCGDKFTTAAGLEDHYARKSIAISFTCCCDRVMRTFYNMCAYALFYKSHVKEALTTVHLSASLCTMEILPAAEMPDVYAEMVRGREERERANAIAVAAAEVTEVAAFVATDAVTVPTESSTGPDGSIAATSTSLPGTKDGNEPLQDASKACVETSQLDTFAEPSVCDMESANEIPADSSDAENTLSVEKLAKMINGRMVRCSECTTVCKNRAGLKVHFSRVSHGGPANSKVQFLGCKHCAMIVPNICAMRAHMRLHGDGAQIFCCPECGLRFRSTKDVFMKHVEQVCLHYARSHGSECPKCEERIAPLPEVIAKHLIDQHSTTYHKCGACPRAFTSEEALVLHNADRHDGNAVNETISKCPICEMVKSSVGELETHVFEHFKDKQLGKTHQLSCSVCKKGQQGRMALIKHMVTEHRDRIITDQMCEICGDLFAADDTYSLYAHILASHREYAISILRSNIGASTAPPKKSVGTADVVPSVSSACSSASVTGSQSVAVFEAVACETSSKKSATAGASSNDLQYGCDHCQMTFKTEVRWKRHHERHEYLATKKLTVESREEVMSVSSQGLKVKITLAKGKGRTNTSKSDDRLSQDTSIDKCSPSEGRAKVNSSMRSDCGKSPSRSRGEARKSPSSQVGVRSSSRSPVRSLKIDASKMAGKSKKTDERVKKVDGRVKKVVKIQAAPAQPKFSCEQCNFLFSSEGEWKAHERTAHKKMSWFPCHLCEVSFKSSASLQSHLKEKHSGKVRQHAFICWICRDQGDVKSYPRAGMLAKHLKMVHKIHKTHPEFAKIKELEASIATGDTPPPNHATTTELTEVRRLRVAGDDTMSYACAHCEFTANERAEFAAHIEEHRERDSSQCQECGASFSVMPALRRHLFAVHRVRDFDGYCTKNGVQLETADDVMDVVDVCTLSMEAESHPVETVAAAVTLKPAKVSSPRVVANSPVPFEGRFECTVCYRTFEDELAHRSHMRVHGMAFIQRTRRSIPSVGAPMGSAETVA